jgi:NADH-quinone oxidoreductase subunit G
LPYDTIEAVRARLAAVNPLFGAAFAASGCDDPAGPAGDPAAIADAPFVLPIAVYWQADAISRASDTMAECARVHAPALAAE